MEAQHRCNSQLLRGSVSARQPATAATATHVKQSDVQTNYWNKRALTLLEPTAGTSAGIICGDQMGHINLSLLLFHSAV